MCGRVFATPLLLLALGVAAAAPPPAGAAASEWSENPESKVRLITPYRVAPLGQEIWLGLHFELVPGWHVYWKNSGDAGFPPVLDLSATPELRDAELLWPAPERYELPGDLVAFGYEDEVVYPVRARLESGADGTLEIVGAVDYLVCEIDCIPYGYTLRLRQAVAAEAEADPETAPLVARWRERLPWPATETDGVETRGWLDLSAADRPVLQVDVTGAGAAPEARPELFLESHETYDVGAPALEETAGGLRFRVPLEPLRALDAEPESATFAWTVTGLAGEGGAATPRAIESRQEVPAASEDPAVGTEAAGAAGPAAAALPKLLARALLGGLVLALSPAVLALLLCTLAELRGGRSPGLRSAAAGGGAIAGALALAGTEIALGTAAGGGWTRLLQRPAAVTALALLALLLALRLWGLAGRHARSTGQASVPALVARAFGTGLVLPLLALPWAVPPAPAAIEGAMVHGAAAGMAAAALAAAGLALPLGLASIGAPARSGRRRDEAVAAARPTEETAPRERFPSREALGFLAALSVVWLLYVLSGLVGSEDLAFVELSLLGVGLGGWASRRAHGPLVRGLWVALAVVAAGVALWIASAA